MTNQSGRSCGAAGKGTAHRKGCRAALPFFCSSHWHHGLWDEALNCTRSSSPARPLCCPESIKWSSNSLLRAVASSPLPFTLRPVKLHSAILHLFANLFLLQAQLELRCDGSSLTAHPPPALIYQSGKTSFCTRNWEGFVFRQKGFNVTFSLLSRFLQMIHASFSKRCLVSFNI